MNEEQLRQLFGGTEAVRPDDDAKSRARAAALVAFDEEKPQSAKDADGVFRPIDTNDRTRRRTMGMTLERWMISGLASAAVMVLAIVFIVQLPSMTDPAQLQERPPSNNVEFSRMQREPAVGGGELSKLEPEPTLADESANRSAPGTNKRVVPETTTTASERSTSLRLTAPAEQPGPSPTVGGEQRASAADAAAPRQPVRRMDREMEEVVVTGHQLHYLPNAEPVNRDRFPQIEENDVKLTMEAPVSTFSIDVDTASYSFVRKQLNQGQLPSADAVRLEEMVNYFTYDYPAPAEPETPFEPTVSVLDSPWRAGNKILHIGIRGYEAPLMQDVKSNLVFLLDVSGSMNQPDKLPLVKQSIVMLLDQLGADDTVALVVYAGAAGIVLEPTPVSEKGKILAAIDRLQAGGSTAGAAGIRLAYQTALANFVPGGVNRVVLATDGDFNVGISDPRELTSFIERQRDAGIFLSVLGFGQGNYQDRTMQALAQNGNGIAAYIDSIGEAHKVLVQQATSTLLTIAKDVKIQVEFNPAAVKEYRLLGYETRALNREDFNNDAVDAGEIGAGHTVTALYEITPAGREGLVEPLRYGRSSDVTGNADEYGFLKIRYKLPEETTSRLISEPITVVQGELAALQRQEAEFALAVAGFAQLLRNGEYIGEWSWGDALALAQKNRGEDEFGYRAEFVQLVRKAQYLSGAE